MVEGGGGGGGTQACGKDARLGMGAGVFSFFFAKTFRLFAGKLGKLSGSGSRPVSGNTRERSFAVEISYAQAEDFFCVSAVWDPEAG